MFESLVSLGTHPRVIFFFVFSFQLIWVAVKHSVQSNTQPIEKYSSNEHNFAIITTNELYNVAISANRNKREAPSDYKIIKHTSRPSKRRPAYRTRKRPPKPKPLYGPPNFNYGSPISDYTLGYTSQGKKNVNTATFPFSSNNVDGNYESDFTPVKTNMYSGHSSYDSTFKANGNGYASPPSTALLPSLPVDNFGSGPSFAYTPPPPVNSYSNQGFKNFAEPPNISKPYDLAGSGTHNIKTIPPSTSYGVPVAPIHQPSQTSSIHQHQQSQSQITQTSNNNQTPQESYISNLYQSFSTPTKSQPVQTFQNNFQNLQPTFSNAGFSNTVSQINQNVGGTNFQNVGPGNFNSGISQPPSVDPSIVEIINKFNQNALNTLTYKSYATSHPPHVKHPAASVTISSSKEIILNRKPSAGKFAEPPANYPNPYQTPVTSYDVPIQHDSSQTMYNIDEPENQFQPTLYQSPQNAWHPKESTTTERNKYLPPTLPTVYDQSQFNSFSNDNDYANNYKEQNDFLDSDGDYGPFLNVPHESKKVAKTKLSKTYGGTSLKQDDTVVESVEIPSDEYVDELISVPTTKKPRTRRRRPRPTGNPSTTHHILDTEDLRDAFSSGTVQYSLSVNPNGKSSSSRSGSKSQAKIAKDKNFVLLSAANTNRNWSRPYPKRPESSLDPINDVKEFLRSEPENKPKGNNTHGIEILSIQKSRSHSYYAGTVPPTVEVKPKQISARYDQPKYDDSMFNVVSTNVRMASNPNAKLAGSGSRRTKKQNFEESGEVGDGKSSREIDPIYWNGSRLPDNHKLAKRIA